VLQLFKNFIFDLKQLDLTPLIQHVLLKTEPVALCIGKNDEGHYYQLNKNEYSDTSVRVRELNAESRRMTLGSEICYHFRISEVESIQPIRIFIFIA